MKQYCTEVVTGDGKRCGLRAVWQHPVHKSEWLCQDHYEKLLSIEEEVRKLTRHD